MISLSGSFEHLAPPDLVWVEAWLALGGRPYPGQRAAIVELGITAVISLHEPVANEAEGWELLGARFISVATRDVIRIPFGTFQIVVDHLREEHRAGNRVLLHCLAGVNRAPTLAAALVGDLHGLSARESVSRVRAVRPSAAPTLEQVSSLRDWLARSRRR